MKKPLRDKYYGQTVDQYIASRLAELSIDAVGVWQIDAAGRDWFGLSGAPLADFVRKVTAALLAEGARPVTGKSENGLHSWLPLDFGSSQDEILAKTLAEWRNPSRGSHAVWFAKSHLI